MKGKVPNPKPTLGTSVEKERQCRVGAKTLIHFRHIGPNPGAKTILRTEH